MQIITLAQLNKHGRTKYITLTLKGDTVDREWGLMEGKTQTTSHTYKTINKGKANELTPEQAAEADYNRIIQTKTKEGYTEWDLSQKAVTPLKADSEALSGMDFNSIPTEFCCSKPISKPNQKKIDKALDKCKAWVEVKYNGLCHYVLCTPEGKIKLYTRRMDDHTAKYPKLVTAMEKDKILPPSSIAIGELCVDPRLRLPHMQAFKIACEIARVDTLEGKLKEDQTEALRRQEVHPMRLAIFGMLYHGGKKVEDTVHDMYIKYISPLPTVEGGLAYFSPEWLSGRTMESIKSTLGQGDLSDLLEGAVVWMSDEKLEVTFNGKPLRRAAYKVKVEKEDDVIAYAWEEGKGDQQGKIGALKIGKLNAKGEMQDLGKVGSGLTDAERDPALWTFPQVIEITYNEVFPTGKYQSSRFSKKHEDKLPEDCTV